MHNIPITERVIKWNTQRYDKVFNFGLAAELLLEETQELYDAKTAIDKMDAIGDIVFVCIGVYWKLGLTNEQIKAMLYELDLKSITMQGSYQWLIDIHQLAIDSIDHSVEGSWPGFELANHCLFVTALGTLRGLKLQNYFYDIVHIICDSNDTKNIEKVNPSVKANITKGLSYKSPTANLFELYSMATQNRKIIQ